MRRLFLVPISPSSSSPPRQMRSPAAAWSAERAVHLVRLEHAHCVATASAFGSNFSSRAIDLIDSIIPLPASPRPSGGGDWTLQRLARRAAPTGPRRRRRRAAPQRCRRAPTDTHRLARRHDPRGGGAAVADWACSGADLTSDTPNVLDFSRRSPYFMAAKFDATAAWSRRVSTRRRHPGAPPDPRPAPMGSATHPRHGQAGESGPCADCSSSPTPSPRCSRDRVCASSARSQPRVRCSTTSAPTAA